MIARALAGLGIAAAIALLARRARSLSPGGAVAATATGTVAIAAGWGWGALLIAYFVLSSALSRLGAGRKQRRTDAVVAKGGARDAVQVLANGGVFALLAAAAVALGLVPDGERTLPLVAVAAAGALAASAADTWATEVGTLIGGTPRSIVTLRPLPAGLSGGVTAAGTLASVAGAAAVAALALLFGWPRVAFLPLLAAGTAGALADSLLGALLQERRRCPRCDALTERPVHHCGTATVAAGGIAGFGNDAVNLVASLVGATAAAAVAAAMDGW